MGDLIGFPGGEPNPTGRVFEPVLTDEHFAFWEMAQEFEAGEVDPVQKGMLQQALEDLSFGRNGIPGVAFPMQPELYVRSDTLQTMGHGGAYAWHRNRSGWEDSHVPTLPKAYYEVKSIGVSREMDGDLVCLVSCLGSIDGLDIEVDAAISGYNTFPVLFSELHPIFDDTPLPIDLMDDLNALS